MTRDLRVVGGAGEPLADQAAPDPDACQAVWAEEFLATKTLRGFSPATVEGAEWRLERVLGLCDRFVWELEPGDIDRLMGELAVRGAGPATRRGYLGQLLAFHRFLAARKAVEIERWFGVRIGDPTDEFNACHHVANDSPAVQPPPTEQRLEGFFGFLRERVATARKYASAARDYALYQTIYLAGLRAAETVALEVPDVHFSRGPFGKLHVRFGKGARTSGPGPRWVPMLDGLDRLLRWYLDDVRPGLGAGPALFCDQEGGVMSTSTVRNRLAYLLELESCPRAERFSPHALRRACATRNYERGVDLVAIQQMLGHWHIGTTMRYVIPSATFIENAYRRAVSDTLRDLEGPGDGREVEAADGGRPTGGVDGS